MSEEAIRKTGRAVILNLVPDVCLTPLPADPSVLVPLPYNIMATLGDSVASVGSVLINGDASFVHSSHVSRVTGDEEGSGGGVISGVNLGACRAIHTSASITVGGGHAVMNAAMFWMNCAGPGGPGNTIGEVILVTEGGGGIPIGVDYDQLRGGMPVIVPETPEEFQWLADQLAGSSAHALGLPAAEVDELSFEPSLTRSTFSPGAQPRRPSGPVMQALDGRRGQARAQLFSLLQHQGRLPQGMTLIGPAPAADEPPVCVADESGTYPSSSVGAALAVTGGISSVAEGLGNTSPWVSRLGNASTFLGVANIGISVAASPPEDRLRTGVTETGSFVVGSLAGATVAALCSALTAPLSGPVGPAVCIITTAGATIGGGHVGEQASGAVYDALGDMPAPGGHDPNLPLPLPAPEAGDHYHPPSASDGSASDASDEQQPVAVPAPTPTPDPTATPTP